MALARSHPRERVDWACGVALEQQSFRYQILRRLVEQATSRLPATPRLLQEHPIIRDLHEYRQEVLT